MMLVPVAATLAALVAQPFRGLRGRGWRALPLLLAPVAMLALLMVPRAAAAPGPAALLAVLALLMLPLALLAAMLLARDEPPGLGAALAGVGVSPAALYWRVRLPALLPGLVLGWLVACLAGWLALAR